MHAGESEAELDWSTFYLHVHLFLLAAASLQAASRDSCRAGRKAFALHPCFVPPAAGVGHNSVLLLHWSLLTDQGPRLHSQWDTHWIYGPGYITGTLQWG